MDPGRVSERIRDVVGVLTHNQKEKDLIGETDGHNRNRRVLCRVVLPKRNRSRD